MRKLLEYQLQNTLAEYNLFFVEILVNLVFCCSLLNNNQLEGQVPEELYSIGVHGGVIE